MNQLSERDEKFQWALLQNLRKRHEREKAIVAEMSSQRNLMYFLNILKINTPE